MTKHRSKEEWIEEILDAAKVEIDQNGYADFSMEAIVRRTGLSKGGIYRFYKNKSEVALEIFADCYRTIMHFDSNTCVEWNLPLDETVFKLFARYSMPEEGARRADRLWVRLLPEVLHDDRFKEARAELIEEIKADLMALFRAVAKRDGLAEPEDLEARMSDAMYLGVGLMEGFAVQSALGSSIEHQAMLARSFVTNVVQDLLK